MYLKLKNGIHLIKCIYKIVDINISLYRLILIYNNYDFNSGKNNDLNEEFSFKNEIELNKAFNNVTFSHIIELKDDHGLCFHKIGEVYESFNI